MRFVGNLTLNLHDCGGQIGFMESYLSSERDVIFTNVAVLIFIFDVTSEDLDVSISSFPIKFLKRVYQNLQKDISYFRKCLSALNHLSKDAIVFCLLHKMDLIQEEGTKEQAIIISKIE